MKKCFISKCMVILNKTIVWRAKMKTAYMYKMLLTPAYYNQCWKMSKMLDLFYCWTVEWSKISLIGTIHSKGRNCFLILHYIPKLSIVFHSSQSNQHFSCLKVVKAWEALHTIHCFERKCIVSKSSYAFMKCWLEIIKLIIFWATLINGFDDTFFFALTVNEALYSMVCIWIYMCFCPVFIRIFSHTYYREWNKHVTNKQKLVIAEIKFLYKKHSQNHIQTTQIHYYPTKPY